MFAWVAHWIRDAASWQLILFAIEPIDCNKNRDGCVCVSLLLIDVQLVEGFRDRSYTRLILITWLLTFLPANLCLCCFIIVWSILFWFCGRSPCATTLHVDPLNEPNKFFIKCHFLCAPCIASRAHLFQIEKQTKQNNVRRVFFVLFFCLDKIFDWIEAR